MTFHIHLIFFFEMYFTRLYLRVTRFEEFGVDIPSVICLKESNASYLVQMFVLL